MITQNKKGKISNSNIGIIVGVVVVAVILILAFNLGVVKKEVAKCDLPLGACLDTDGKIIAGVTAQADCEGIMDSAGIKGVWNEGPKCYQIGMNGALAPIALKNGITVEICKKYTLTYRYIETGICLVNLKPVETADSKVKCEGQGVWDATLSPCTAA